jgi:hypothetical protein
MSPKGPPGRVKRMKFAADAIRVRMSERPIDRLAWRFCRALNRARVEYAVVSGYAALVLGRDRESEDVDIIAKPMGLTRFVSLHRSLSRDFECISPGLAPQLFAEYLSAGKESTSVRYSEPGTFVPNVEFKFAHNALHHLSIERRRAVFFNGHRLFIGPLGMQVAYKVWLGTPKDLEDARWICHVAGTEVDQGELTQTLVRLGISEAKGRKALALD